MTNDEIIRMAREAGFEVVDGELRLYFDSSKALLKPNYIGTVVDGLKTFAALVAAHERKACAKESFEVLDDVRKEAIAQCQKGMIEAYKLGQSEEREACAKVCEARYNSPDFNNEAIECADAIRARGE